MIDSTAQVHPTAIVAENVKIGANVKVGPFCVIEAGVEIGSGTEIMSHVVIKGPTTIGEDNRIFQFVTLGEACQDLKYAGEPTRLEIGDRNIIRESVTMHRGTVQDQGLTKVGSDNLFMINAHIAHDCLVGNHCIFANNATLGGHVKIGNHVIIGGMSAVHQFCIVGDHSMIGGCSAVVQDVPPYLMAQGNHCVPFGVNIEGLKRRGFDKLSLHTIRRAYKAIYRSGRQLDEVKQELIEQAETFPELALFNQFFAQSTRGIIR